jgi:hypothetical protein
MSFVINQLKIPKRYGGYVDTALCLGLAKLALLTQRQLNGTKTIELADLGTAYQIQFAQELDLNEIVADLTFEPLFLPVKGDKTDAMVGLDWSDIAKVFNTKKNTEIRKIYRAFQQQSKQLKQELSEEERPPEPDPRTQNGVTLTSMRHDRNHNGIWKAAYDIQDHFGALVASIFRVFAGLDGAESQPDPFQQIADYFKTYTGEKLPADASAVKIFFPTYVQGVNREKADSNKVDGSSQKEPWVMLWLIAAGLFEFGIAERIKVADNTFDWRVVLLEPRQIRLFHYRKVLDEVRKFSPPTGAHGVARFDAELSLRLSQKLLTYHPAKEVDQPVSHRKRRTSLKEMVSGFSGTHFGSKGQVYGVKEVFSLGLPDWIHPNNAEEIKSYQALLDEHLAIVRSLSIDEGDGELLSAYRDFITGNELNQFFRFNISYADYIVRKLADSKTKFPPKQFTHTGLDIMAQGFHGAEADWSITDITQNQGFQRIARAINSATVYAGKITFKQADGTYTKKELKWKRIYGLAQRLGNNAGSKKEFVTELTAFLAEYQNENLRLQDQLEDQPRRIWVTHEDLEDFFVLMDKYSYTLVANLLLAYSYARWKKTLKEEPDTTPIVEDENSEADAQE